MKIDKQELLEFFKTYKHKIFESIDFNTYHIDSVFFNDIVDGNIESVVNIHSNTPDHISDFKINGTNVSMNYHIVMTPKIPIKDFMVFSRSNKIKKLISSFDHFSF